MTNSQTLLNILMGWGVRVGGLELVPLARKISHLFIFSKFRQKMGMLSWMYKDGHRQWTSFPWSKKLSCLEAFL